MLTIVKTNKKNSQQACNGNNMYVVLRNEKDDVLFTVPRTELISTKKSSKIEVGDVVSHGVRGKRIRGTIVLLGKILLILLR